MRAKIILMLLVLLVSLTFASDRNLPGGDETPVAQVKKIIKNVEFRDRTESEWLPAKVSTPLYDGGQVKTDAKSVAVILFTDGSGLLRVRENSILNVYAEIKNRKMNKNTYIDRGSVSFDVKKQEDEEFKFTTPTAVASIRGTSGLFDVVDNGESTMILETGSVELETKTGKKVSLTAGYTASFDRQGNANVVPSSEEDKKKLAQGKSLTTKKVIIKTKFGDVEVEYFPDENK
ncbi:MAG: hypothetical protein CVV24_05735 [Ignavibacteriae bacterium HGW-Ignavibacteriae-3]|nr:MAG: hypothetical protein CVV24_05735 [Ignavibacteriae bacterium HGW-Ignavibacteriae-3]